MDDGAVAVLCNLLSSRLFPTTPLSRLVHVEDSTTDGAGFIGAQPARAKGSAEQVIPGASQWVQQCNLLQLCITPQLTV